MVTNRVHTNHRMTDTGVNDGWKDFLFLDAEDHTITLHCQHGPGTMMAVYEGKGLTLSIPPGPDPDDVHLWVDIHLKELEDLLFSYIADRKERAGLSDRTHQLRHELEESLADLSLDSDS